MMRHWQLGRIENGKIHIGEIGEYLGLVDGSQIFSVLFRYDDGESKSYELVLSNFGPENYKQICQLTFVMKDQPGACAQVSKFLSDRDVDILNSSSLTSIPHKVMVWRMLADISYFGEPDELLEEFSSLKRMGSAKLDKVTSMELESSKISERYTTGSAGKCSNILTKAIKQREKSPAPMKDGLFEIPKDFLAEMKDVVDKQPVLMVDDQDNYALSITFLPMDIQPVGFKFIVPDRPGAVGIIVDILANHKMNIISISSDVMIYNDSMSLDIVADSRCASGIEAVRADLENAFASAKGRFELMGIDKISI
ncbi:hypothetical protein [Candidatus Methanomassiliicoccus intestinalis]|uniref:hypothetical protein n=1 Tax=Candidatus Methanomassiliicoccus intestinalis TaxID=1406512 RepID=UPI0037DCB092